MVTSRSCTAVSAALHCNAAASEPASATAPCDRPTPRESVSRRVRLPAAQDRFSSEPSRQ